MTAEPCGFKIDKRWPCTEPRGHEFGPASWARLHATRTAVGKLATAPDGMTFFEAIGVPYEGENRHE